MSKMYQNHSPAMYQLLCLGIVKECSYASKPSGPLYSVFLYGMIVNYTRLCYAEKGYFSYVFL